MYSTGENSGTKREGGNASNSGEFATIIMGRKGTIQYIRECFSGVPAASTVCTGSTAHTYLLSQKRKYC